MKIFRSDGYYIPIAQAPEVLVSAVTESYTHYIYDDKRCSNCQFLEDRHGENCDSCESFKGIRPTGGVTKRGEKTYLKVPVGGMSPTKNVKVLGTMGYHYYNR